MKKILLMDISNIAWATYYIMQSNGDEELETDAAKMAYWKFLMFNSIKKNKIKHNPDEFVICVDSMSWRRKAFQYYKAKRDQVRQESNFDMKFFVENMNKFIDDLDKNFPYTVMRINGAEADDIIAVLAQTLDKNSKVIIASNDKDFRQLVGGNIHLWSMREEKFIDIEDRHEFLICHILKGDGSDGIPNVRSDDDTFIVDGKRQKPCGDKLIGKILEEGLEEWFDSQWKKDIAVDEKKKGTKEYQGLIKKSNQLRRNFKRNKKLIDLSMNSIPNNLWKVVVEKYNSKEKKKSNYTKILHYFSKNGMRNLISETNKFM